MNTNEKNLINGYIYYYDQNLLAGDIVLTSANTATSKAIRLGTQSEFSHVMMMINKCAYVHAIANGVESGNIQREIFDKPEYMQVLRLKNREKYALSLEQVIKKVTHDIAKPYSVPNAINAKFKIPFNFNTLETKRYCSQLVALAYKEANIDLVKNPNHCTPEEILQSGLLEKINIKLTDITSSEIHPLYKLSLLEPNPLILHNQQIREAIIEVQKITFNSYLSFYDIDNFLVKNKNFDETITYTFLQKGYFDFPQKIKEANPYRYGNQHEFKDFIDKNYGIKDRKFLIQQLKEMSSNMLLKHKEDLEMVKHAQKKFGNLHFIQKKIELYKCLCEMYNTLLNNCNQYI